MTATKTMPRYGVLDFPVSYVPMDTEEMTYLDGGKVTSTRYTAKSASNYCTGMMAAWWLLAGGYGLTAAAAAAPTAGIGTLVAGVGAAYCSYVATQYTSAYNAAQKLTIGGKNPYCYVDETTFLGIITAVDIR